MDYVEFITILIRQNMMMNYGDAQMANVRIHLYLDHITDVLNQCLAADSVEQFPFLTDDL